MKPKTLAGKSLVTTTIHGLGAFLQGESLLCNFFSHNITSCSMTKPTSSNEFRTLSIEFWLLRYFSNKRDIIFSTSLSKRIKLSTRLRRGRRALVAEMISALAAILDQRCIPLAELEITAGAKLHFWAACGPSVSKSSTKSPPLTGPLAVSLAGPSAVSVPGPSFTPAACLMENYRYLRKLNHCKVGSFMYMGFLLGSKKLCVIRKYPHYINMVEGYPWLSFTSCYEFWWRYYKLFMNWNNLQLLLQPFATKISQPTTGSFQIYSIKIRQYGFNYIFFIFFFIKETLILQLTNTITE